MYKRQCRVSCAFSSSELCYFCWFDFQATDEERAEIGLSEAFRQRSVNLWYKRLGIPRMAIYFWTPETYLHYFHDCFRAYGTTAERTLDLAGEPFAESVTWLRQLIDGTLPTVSPPNNPSRIFEFGRGAGRTPLWYMKDDRWYWSPHSSLAEWIVCPQLIVPSGIWQGQVPREQNVFIILFLHRYRPEPCSSD